MSTNYFVRPAFGYCRALVGHHWQVPRKGAVTSDGGVAHFHFQCETCDSVRVDHIHLRTGALEGRSYRYTKGYQFKLNGKAQPDREELRAEVVQRLAG